MLIRARERLRSLGGRSDSDAGPAPQSITAEPDLYPFAAQLARLHGCSTLFELGCRDPARLEPFAGQFRLLRGGPRPAPAGLGPGGWRQFEPHGYAPPEPIEDAAIICADGLTGRSDPRPLLNNLRRLLDQAPFGLLSIAPEAAPASADLERLLAEAGLRAPFLGMIATDDRGYAKQTTLAVLESRTGPVPERRPSPDDFCVVALMAVYNEADVIEDSIRALVSEGVDVYVIDNWSTDGSFELVQPFLGRGVIGHERFPDSEPPGRMASRTLHRRMMEVSASLRADWFVSLDADERRRSPWLGVGLRDAIYHVDRSGFNCIDHTVVVFHPADDEFAGGDVEDHFRHFEFGQRPGHFLQRKAWKNTGQSPDRAATSGHDTNFSGRRIYPYKFLLKHYPIRSQAHGERKIIRERRDRYDLSERAEGLHSHYDLLAEQASYLRDPGGLLEFSPERFNREYLIERLSGIGIPRLEPAPSLQGD